MSASASLPSGYFDAVYAANADPWDFESSPYEAAKYSATVAALGERHYASALEVGCSIGVLSERLALRCERLLSIDAAEAPLARARMRCRALPQVEFRCLRMPEQEPPGRFDLVVLSEVGYYWSPGDLERVFAQIERQLEADGDLLLVHWTPFVADYPQSGDQVHDAALAHAGAGDFFVHRRGQRQPTYRLDLFGRRRVVIPKARMR